MNLKWTLALKQGYSFSIFVIIFLTIVFWHSILNQTLLGEGYYYFSNDQNFIENGQIISPWQHDNLARIIFDILPIIFQDNIEYYLVFQLLVMIALYLTLFFVIYKITQNLLISLITVLLFLTNYVGSYEMIAIGNYQRFVQRVPNLIIMLISFYYLFKYFEIKKIIYLQLSFLTYILGVFLAHFSFFLFPLFIIYPFTNFIYSKISIKDTFISISIIIFYVLVTKLLLVQDNFTPHQGLIEFIKTEPFLYERLFFQLTNITIPPDIIDFLSTFYGKTTLSNEMLVFYKLTPIITFCYIGFFFLLYKKSRKQACIYLTFLLSTLLYMFLYTYIDEKNNVLKGYGEGRFFFISTMLISLNWSLILIYFANNIKAGKWALIIIILTTVCLYNFYKIDTNIQHMQYKSTAMKNYVEYIKSKAPLDNQTVIVSPAAFQWPYTLIDKYYTDKPLKYFILEPGWEDNVKSYPKKYVMVIDYKYYLDDDGYYSPYKGQIIDLTENYRKGEKILPLNANGYRQ